MPYFKCIQCRATVHLLVRQLVELKEVDDLCPKCWAWRRAFGDQWWRIGTVAAWQTRMQPALAMISTEARRMADELEVLRPVFEAALVKMDVMRGTNAALSPTGIKLREALDRAVAFATKKV